MILGDAFIYDAGMHDAYIYAPWSLCICQWCINVWCIHPLPLRLDSAACVCELNHSKISRIYKCVQEFQYYVFEANYQVKRFLGPYGNLWHDKHQHYGDSEARLSVVKRNRNREVFLLIVGTHPPHVFRTLGKINCFNLLHHWSHSQMQNGQKVEKFCKTSSQDN